MQNFKDGFTTIDHLKSNVWSLKSQILKQIEEKNPFQNHKQASIGNIWTPRTLETYDSKQMGKINEKAQLKHIQTEKKHEYTVLENRLH